MFFSNTREIWAGLRPYGAGTKSFWGVLVCGEYIEYKIVALFVYKTLLILYSEYRGNLGKFDKKLTKSDG